MRVLFIIWSFFIETLSALTLLVCGIYLMTKVVIFFEMREPFVALSFVGMGLVLYYIHESLFRQRREKVMKAFKK